MLVLIDIDGTLLLGVPGAHTAALAAAMRDVYGVAVGPQDIREIGPAGRTDREIARLVLGRQGLAEDAIVAGLDAWVARASDVYPGVERGFPPPRRAPGAPEALARLNEAGASLALLTGNLEPIAHAKMAAAGLDGWFPRGRGAFGSDHDRREALVPIAMARDGGETDLVVVGDTPRDIACARAGGARCVAVTTGPHGAAALAAADAVVDGLLPAAEVICGWIPRPAA